MNVLLLLNHNFVASPDAESIVAQKKEELFTQHPGAQLDQLLLSNVVLGKVELQTNHYDSIYYLDHEGFNPQIPNHPSIKDSLKTTTVQLNRPAGSRVGTKLSKLRLKKFNKATVPVSAPSPTPSLPELVKMPTEEDAQKKLRYFSDDSDEDELINEEDLVEVLNPGSIICLREPSTGGKKRRKACKDCTCGLAEQEAFGFDDGEPAKPVVQFTKEELSEIDFTVEGKTGGCGSCSLGDAFRCSGCPFLGLPAFKPGQAISLEGIDDDL